MRHRKMCNMLLSTAEASKRLKNIKTGEVGISPRRVLQLIHDGALNGILVGNSYVVDSEEIDKFNALDRAEGKPGHRRG